MSLALILILQISWSASYIAMKLAVAEMPVGLAMILRYGLAVLFFALAGFYGKRPRFSAREWALVALVGVVNFTGSPFFQLKSVTLAPAMDVSILVAFEPLIAALLAVFFLKERLEKSTLTVFGIATVGVFVMSGWQGSSASFDLSRLAGDGLFICSLVAEGIYQVSSRHLTQKHSPFRLAAWMILFGFLTNLLANTSLLTAENFSRISITGWSALVYLALICSTIGYGAWCWLLKKTPVSVLSLSLFLQPIAGSALAALILKEPFTLQTAMGGALVVTSLFVWATISLRQRAFLPSS